MRKAPCVSTDQSETQEAIDNPGGVEAIIHPRPLRNQGGIILNQALTEVMTSINRRFGPDTLRPASMHPQNEFFFTGISELDKITGGIPVGRIVDIFGGEGSGKSALALHMAQSAGEVLYMDADNGLAHAGGLSVMHPETLEDALQVVEIAAPAFDAIVIDTLAALPSKAEALLDMGDFYTESSAAAVLSRALPRLVPVLLKNRCTLILVNQLREVPGIIYGRPTKSTGGRALRYYTALKLETTRIEGTRRGGERIGQRTRVKVQKNKYGAPFGEAELFVMYGRTAA